MDVVAGAMGNLAPKLLLLLQDEYKLQKGVKAQVKSLAKELESMHVALSKVAQVPYDQLDPQVKLWASQAREASYDMEDILDNFFVRVDGCDQPTDADKGIVQPLVEKMSKMLSLSRINVRRPIAGAIDDIKKKVLEIIEGRDRYGIDDVVANSATTNIDPRVLINLHTKASEFVGIDEPRDELMKMTLGDDDASDKEMKIVSVVGFGGIGKTTLAKVVYDELTMDVNMYCKAFVPVGQNPDLKKVFRDILLDLNKTRYMSKTNFMILDERQLVAEIQAFLKEKRYFIVIDDVWDVPSWMAIRIALEDNYMGSKIIITTRSNDVAELAHCTYKVKPLLPESSKALFYGRIFRSQDRCPESFAELSDKILRKCHGMPLAINTIASLLANKQITEWEEVCSSIGSGLNFNDVMYNDMRKILSLSYFDLPSHMKTCFLYLSMYPKQYLINRDQLIWRWISEGFIQPQRKGNELFELGKMYFNDLINRSLIQPVVDKMDDEIYACRVNNMILDLICFLSREENFVTISNDIEQVMTPESKKIRRLSLNGTTTWPKKGVTQVRSIVVFRPSFDSMPSFSCYPFLRVLDLEGCSLKNCEGSQLYIEYLIHLRYLGLRGTSLKVLPAGVENARYLIVLKLSRHIELPESMFGRRQLMCLEGVHCCPRPGNLLRNLASLQVLDTLYLDEDSSEGAVEALGYLTQLTMLKIVIKLEIVDQSFCDALVNSLGNLPRLQMLQIFCNGFINLECWAPPPHLRQLVYGTSSRTLPKWITPASLPHLTSLGMNIHTVRPEDIQIIGMLPNLVAFQLTGDCRNYIEQPLQKFVVSLDAFPRLRRCNFRYVATVPSMFARGAMARVEDIRFYVRARDFFAKDGLDFKDLAIDHLPSLQSISCVIHSETGVKGEEEAEKLREALKHAADVHPNHPVLFCY